MGIAEKFGYGEEVMEITQIKDRIEIIGMRLAEINREQAQSGLELARAQGTDSLSGISIDPLTEWARRMRSLNAEASALVAERKELRETKKELRTCDCNCH